MKKISLGIGAFALPAPRRGSIDAYSGFGRATQVGMEIHQRVQEKREAEHENYQRERALTHAFERGGYRFEVNGRCDGFFADGPKIEEIKSTFNTKELARHLRAGPYEHPYCLQLATYGYFYWRETNQIPELSFHLVSTRDFEALDLDLPFEISRYETWLERRLAELEKEAAAAEERARRRRKNAARLSFPFAEARSGQKELMATIESAMREKQRLLVQAPTGLGKTVGVLFPTLKEALARGQRVVYVTPKNSQHAVAEEAISLLQEKGAKIRSLTVTAKSKICMQNEPVCKPENCRYAKDHYTKVAEHGVLELLAKKKKLTARVFRKLAQDFEICPFEIQFAAALEADTVICDYNYVFAPRSALERGLIPEIDQEGKPNLVIDEAHNLPARAMDYYSPALSTTQLERMRDDLRELPLRFRADALTLLDRCLEVVQECWPDKCAGPTKIDPPAALFLEQDAELRAFLSRYLESELEILAGDPVLKLCFYWSAFTEALEFVEDRGREEFFTTFHPQAGGGSVKITCCDASEMLKGAYENYEQVVGFSATLKPFDYYSRLSGLSELAPRTAEFPSPFPRDNRKVLIIPQISSKFSERERNYQKVADAIARISGVRPGNYLAFFPSFHFLEQVLARIQPPPGFRILRQERHMKASEIEDLLTQLRTQEDPLLVFAVQGGVFSEGIDYPGAMAIGAFVVGPPLPTFDLEREEMRAYYERHYGAGFDYAYTYPAMAKAVQAAGRVIRSETDRGLIVLMDNRFLQPSYAKSMPQEWFREGPGELVSQAILREVEEFWGEERTPTAPREEAQPG
jgi:DNA excision repair protein ERCC-2